MKLRINNRLRTVLMVVLALSVVFVTFLFFREKNKEEFKEDAITKYSYNQKLGIEYQAYLKPNKLYEKNTLGEGELYITEFIDNISTNLKYEFQGEKQGSLGGEYEVIARVEGYNGEGEEISNIWEKDFVLIPKKRFKITEEIFDINEKINIKLDEYANFASEIVETSKVNSQTRLNFLMNVNLKGSVEGEEVDEIISTNLLIPLNTGMFSVGGENSILKEGKIEEKINVKLPPNKTKLIIYGAIFSLLSILITLGIFFTEGIKNKKTQREKALKSIFKKHGDRLVAIEGEINLKDKDVKRVKSIDDLVRIADEEGKPIMYRYSENEDEINLFYVGLENSLYILDITKGESYTYQVNTSNQV